MSFFDKMNDIAIVDMYKQVFQRRNGKVEYPAIWSRWFQCQRSKIVYYKASLDMPLDDVSVFDR